VLDIVVTALERAEVGDVPVWGDEDGVCGVSQSEFKANLSLPMRQTKHQASHLPFPSINFMLQGSSCELNRGLIGSTSRGSCSIF